MRTKREIESQLKHLKDGGCTGGDAQTHFWIQALEWVLGDETHQAVYDQTIKILYDAPPITWRKETEREKCLASALRVLLERMR